MRFARENCLSWDAELCGCPLQEEVRTFIFLMGHPFSSLGNELMRHSVCGTNSPFFTKNMPSVLCAPVIRVRLVASKLPRNATRARTDDLGRRPSRAVEIISRTLGLLVVDCTASSGFVLVFSFGSDHVEQVWTRSCCTCARGTSAVLLRAAASRNSVASMQVSESCMVHVLQSDACRRNPVRNPDRHDSPGRFSCHLWGRPATQSNLGANVLVHHHLHRKQMCTGGQQ